MQKFKREIVNYQKELETLHNLIATPEMQGIMVCSAEQEQRCEVGLDWCLHSGIGGQVGKERGILSKWAYQEAYKNSKKGWCRKVRCFYRVWQLLKQYA